MVAHRSTGRPVQPLLHIHDLHRCSFARSVRTSCMMLAIYSYAYVLVRIQVDVQLIVQALSILAHGSLIDDRPASSDRISVTTQNDTYLSRLWTELLIVAIFSVSMRQVLDRSSRDACLLQVYSIHRSIPQGCACPLLVYFIHEAR
jgi:hypothetical protein